MKWVRWFVAAMLLVVFGYRAQQGLIAGLDMARGVLLGRGLDYRAAAELLERAALGFNRLDALRLSADAQLDVWDHRASYGGPLDAGDYRLSEAASDYLECLCISPVSRRPWEGLAVVYHSLEWVGREQRSELDRVPDVEPWSRVGRAGRIAVGMMRRAVVVAPGWFAPQDWLAKAYWLYGLQSEAEQAVRDSARSLPIYYRHDFRAYLDDWVPEIFAETSLDILGQVPFVSETKHKIDLAKLLRGLGNNQRAAELLTEVLAGNADALNRAEANYHLGRALLDLGREDEGIERLHLAAEHPAFRVAATLGLADWAERSGLDGQALEYLYELRRLDPTNIDLCIRFARVARRLENWTLAQEALRWAKTLDPTDPRLPVELIRLDLEKGDLVSARAKLRQLPDRSDYPPELAQLRRQLGVP